MNIEINQEFKALIPPLSLEEYSQLEKNIIADGCREPLVVFNNTLVDGHNRYEICTKHDLPFSILDKEFADSSHAKEWMILNQFGRRNLINYQRSVLALEIESVYSERAKEKQREAGGAVPQMSAKAPIDTRKEVAKVANVSHDTIAKVKKIQSTATQEVKDKLEHKTMTNHLNFVIKPVEKVSHCWVFYLPVTERLREPTPNTYRPPIKTCSHLL